MPNGSKQRKSGRYLLGAVLCALLPGVLASVEAAPTVPVTFGSTTRYLANSSDPGTGLSWTEAGFDDSSWQSGVYGVGYETGYGAQNLLLTTVPPGTMSIYTRTSFEIADVSQITALGLGVDYDDGYVAWLNGIEVARSPGLPAIPAWDSGAPSHESSNGSEPTYEPVDISSVGLPALQNGTNVLAVGIWNTDATSSDLVLAPRLTLNPDTVVLRGPYLQLGTPDSVVIRWRTNTLTSSRVLYGTQPGTLTQVVEDSTPTLEHVVSVSGLTPDTRYYYAVGSDAGILAGDDPSFYFVTSPPPGTTKPTRIWVLGDSGTGDAFAQAVRDAYYAYTGNRETDVWLMLGDNAYLEGSDGNFQTKLFDIYPGMLRKSVLWPTLGNHDAVSALSATQSGPYYDIFTLPRNAEAGGVASGTEAYYSFDYANIHFVVLDSCQSNRSPIGPMALWLQQDLAATLQDWIIVYFHHPPYSKGSHDSDTELNMVQMRENFVPIFDDYGVDLVLTGHSHSYERSYLIEGHYGTSDTFSESMKVDPGDGREDGDGPYQKSGPGLNPHSGILYTVAGSSGQTSGGPLDHPAMFYSLNEHGSLVIDINQGRLDLKFLDKDGVIRDYFTMFKGPVVTAPVAQFDNSSAVGHVPLPVDFVDQSLNEPTAWNWDFDGDGGVDSTQQHPSFLYDDPGIYTVSLTVSNVSGADENRKTNLICAHDGPPAEVTGLRFEADRATFDWDPEPTAVNYDLVKGDLGLLISTAGDFQVSQLGCLEDDGIDVTANDSLVPQSSQGYYYLVRATNCASETGSYDTIGIGQSGTRDPELQGLTASCGCDALDDADLDGFCNGFDTCTDTDGDGLGDPGFSATTCVIDNCPSIANPNQTDQDADLIGDACDPCPLDSANDADGDTVCGDVDNCPLTANSDQSDLDADGTGDVCDDCTDPDLDGFGVPGLPASTCPDDNCPFLANSNQADGDGDAVGDVCDPCPLDADNDIDADTVCGDVDNCPTIANAGQQDLDGDGIGDPCDVCPNDFRNDVDHDGVCGDVDNCPMTSNPDQADMDSDGIGDTCDLCQDTDGDGYGNPGFPGNTCPQDNCQYAYNPEQIDTDLDGQGDECDICPLDPLNDADLDFVCANLDNCPSVTNPNQTDRDGDSLGDACDDCPDDPDNDIDRDRICGDVDNCPTTANFNQADTDGDLLGDVCDACPADPGNDADFDGLCGDVDNCPSISNPGQENFDGDAMGDVCDPDDDNDGYDDTVDCAPYHRGLASAPDPIGLSVRFNDQDNGTLSWNRSLQGHTVNVYRSAVRWGGGGGSSAFGCLAGEVVGTEFADGDVPRNRELYSYLLTARNACGDSDAGIASDGTPRQPEPACATGGKDSDSDGLLDVEDNCSLAPNPSQADADLDFVGDDCDNCPVDFNPDQADMDGDGLGDACDASSS